MFCKGSISVDGRNHPVLSAREGMDEKRRRFSFERAQASKEGIRPESKCIKRPAVDGSTASKKVHLVFSIYKGVMKDAVVRQY